MPLSINHSEFETPTNNNQDPCFIDIDIDVKEETFVLNQELTEVADNALNTVIKYYLDGKGHTSLPKLIRDQVILLIVAITGAGLYATAADDYAQSIGEKLAGRINYMVCTCLPALVVLYNSTELFLIMRRSEIIPAQLNQYLTNPSTHLQKNLEDIAITIGAAISALPLAAVSYMYPIPGLSKSLLLFQGIIVLIDNTILHLFPFKLAFSEPLYRLPSLPFECIVRQMMNCRLKQEVKDKKKLQMQINQSIQAIKQRLINHLECGQKLLSIYGFKFLGCNYANEVKKQIDDEYSRQNLPTGLLIALLNCLHDMAPHQSISPLSRLRKFFRILSYVPGALWVMSSCAGFLAAPVNEMTELTGSPALGATFSTPPIYFLGVLLSFFGGNALQNTFDYFTDWKEDAVKVPMAFKLYPKTSVLLIFISMYLSAFSYAAGAQLINDNFKGDLAFLRPYLLYLAKTGLTFLGFTAMIDFFNNMLSKFGQYGRNEDAQTVIKLSEAFGQMSNSFQRMKPVPLLESLACMNEGCLNSILNVKDKTDQQSFSEILIQLAEKLKVKLLKEFESIDLADIDEAKFIKLLSQLKNDLCYTVDKIESLLIFFDTDQKSDALPVNLKEVCQEYKAVCKLIATLDGVSLAYERELDTFPRDDRYAGPSSETTPLLITPGGSIQTRFFHHYASTSHRSSLSPIDLTIASSQIGR